MLSGMAETCYVRYPDDVKDDPSQPGQPNSAILISAHKLDDYRANGYVQCAEDGGPLPKVLAKGAGGGDDPETVTVATHKDDPIAAELLPDDDPRKGGPKKPSPAPAGGNT